MTRIAGWTRWPGTLICLGLGCLIGCSSPDAVHEPAAASEGETLHVIPPSGWVLGASSNQGKFRRAKYLRDPDAPVEESLTFEYMDPDGLPDPIAFLETMAAEQQERCQDFHSVAIGSGLENGYPSAVRLLRCPRRKVNQMATVSLAKAIQGTDGYYLIVFESRAAAVRGEDGWQLEHVNESDIASWSLYLRQATLCDSSSAEHPCDASAAASAADPAALP